MTFFFMMIGWTQRGALEVKVFFHWYLISLDKWREIWWCLLLLYYTSMHWTIPHPLPSLSGGTGWLKWLQAVTPNYSNCISYNFFIFCSICLKFSHKFLHTYSFILCIKKKNSKICENRVADQVVGPLKAISGKYLHYS